MGILSFCPSLIHLLLRCAWHGVMELNWMCFFYCPYMKCQVECSIDATCAVSGFLSRLMPYRCACTCSSWVYSGTNVDYLFSHRLSWDWLWCRRTLLIFAEIQQRDPRETSQPNHHQDPGQASAPTFAMVSGEFVLVTHQSHLAYSNATLLRQFLTLIRDTKNRTEPLNWRLNGLVPRQLGGCSRTKSFSS